MEEGEAQKASRRRLESMRSGSCETLLAKDGAMWTARELQVFPLWVRVGKRWEEQMKKGKVPMGRGGNARNTCSVQKCPSWMVGSRLVQNQAGLVCVCLSILTPSGHHAPSGIRYIRKMILTPSGHQASCTSQDKTLHKEALTLVSWTWCQWTWR